MGNTNKRLPPERNAEILRVTVKRIEVFSFFYAVLRFTGKTRITGKTTEILERPKNNRETLISALAKTFID